jgi:hypothetical protein
MERRTIEEAHFAKSTRKLTTAFWAHLLIKPRIRRVAKAILYHPLLERTWQSQAGRLIRRAIALPITDKIGDLTRIEGILVSTNKYGTNLRFFVRNRRDLIQVHHFDGGFYEEEELDIIRKYFNGGIFVDIGANVGNHTIFVAKMLNSRKVIPFGLNPKPSKS